MSQKNTAQQTSVLGNTLANVVGQVGCITLVFIGLAFAAGTLLDNFLNLEMRIFTILFLVGSVPVALYVVARVSFATVSKAQSQLEITDTEDDSDS